MTRSTKFRLLAAVAVTMGLLTSLLGPTGSPASATSDVTTERLGGADRFATAAEVARESHPGAQTALIANGFNFPDALAGSTLAGALNAPILLVTPTSIPAATSAALNDLGVNDVVILGGPAAVSTEVENQLRTNYGVTRVQGDDRYKTAVEIGRRAAVGGVGTVDGLRTAFVSTGLNFPDALGAGPLAYEGNLPSFLTRTNELPAEVAQAIRDLNIEHVVILGGTQAISETVKSQIEATGASTERLNGKNRAETATFVADFALARMGFEGVNVLLARGDNFPDALAGGPLGGERRAVLLLTATSCQLAIETRIWLEEHFGTVARIFVLGGPAAVCDAVVREAEAAAETNNLPPSQVDLTISGGSTNGGPKWQYQEEDASPSKSLSLSAFVSSDPPEGSDDEAERVPSAREDVVFNIKPTQGDDAANTELNLTARTDSNGVARVSYTRGAPGTDIITVRVVDDTSLTDDGVGRWSGQSAPILLDPNEAATLEANQPREFTVTLEGASPTARTVNLTTLELVDDVATNDTNKGALTFTAVGDPPPIGPAVTDDRSDGDQTLATITVPAGQSSATFTVSSSAAQIYTLMAFLDSISTPAANDDNTNPPEFRDIAGSTGIRSDAAGLVITPPNDGTTITRRNGQQIVYTVTAVDEQGQPLSGLVDVTFEQLVDGQPATTTSAEFDWVDNSSSPSTQEGSENEVPPGATARPAGTTRIEVAPNAQGVFTFAITHPQRNAFPTSGNPIAWLDLPGGVNNRPDSTEPQARGRNFTFNTGAVNVAASTLEALACPPGTDQRGLGNNPVTMKDPCLGMDVLPEDPHVPWPFNTAPESDTADASTSGVTVEGPDGPMEISPGISHGDITMRFTFRDATGTPKTPTSTGTTGAPPTVTFRVSNVGSGAVAAAPNRPNTGSQASRDAEFDDFHTIPVTGPYAELIVDGSASTSAARASSIADVEIVATSGFDLVLCSPAAEDPCLLRQTATWLSIATETTDEADVNTARTTFGATATNCPSAVRPPHCFNGNLVAIDKARDSYVMLRGGTAGETTSSVGRAYVVYAVGGGGEPYVQDPVTNLFTSGERPSGIDEYFIDGLRALTDQTDNDRCGFSRTGYPVAPGASTEQDGCARFEAAMSFDDRMVYEFAGNAPTLTQTHFLTNGDAPIGE